MTYTNDDRDRIGKAAGAFIAFANPANTWLQSDWDRLKHSGKLLEALKAMAAAGYKPTELTAYNAGRFLMGAKQPPPTAPVQKSPGGTTASPQAAAPSPQAVGAADPLRGYDGRTEVYVPYIDWEHEQEHIFQTVMPIFKLAGCESEYDGESETLTVWHPTRPRRNAC